VDAREFVAGLVAEMNGLFAELGEHETLESESGGQVAVVPLLKLALASELEASEIAGYWLTTTPELDGKMVLAHQCGDEMKHYQLICDRLAELGEDVSDYNPLAEGYSPLFEYLKSLATTAERIAAGPFASEAIAEVRNAQFISFCHSVGDRETARLYESTIHPEEINHYREGREYLERHADSPEVQQAVTTAVRTTLTIADELRTLTEKTTGMRGIPTS
jgi:1,2-phenylacetyl-CoA epoxidase catalytic subunit